MAFSHLLRDIISSQEMLEMEMPRVTQIYSLLSILAIAVNLVLMYSVFYIPYRSTTAVFLSILMILDLHEACLLLLNMVYLYGSHIMIHSSEDTSAQRLNQYQQLVWWFFCMYAMLLVAFDRWKVHNTSDDYLFKQNRKTKIGCSLAAFVILVAVVNFMLPMTVEITVMSETVDVFICITHSCYGSSLLMHAMRSPNDKRIKLFMKFLQGSFFLICLVFIPIYGCIWNAVLRKAQTDKEYEKERAKITQRGQEVVYFNDIHVPKLKRQSDLPVIYEVDEDNENVVDKGIVFPYTLQIFHKASSLCSLTKEHTCLYDDKPIPENAQPLIVKNFAVRGFDSIVDKHPGFRLSGYKRPSLLRIAYKSKFPSRRGSFNLNRNALPPAWNKSSVRTSKVSLPSAEQAPIETCHQCQHKKHVYQHRDALSMRQIVFSINCCCNRGAPIDYHTEITYLNAGDYSCTARPSMLPHIANCSRNMETVEYCKNNISYNHMHNPGSGNPQDMTVLYDTNIRCTIPRPGCLQVLHQEDSTVVEMTLTQSYANHQHHGDRQSPSLPAGPHHSYGFPEVDSVLQISTKSCPVTHYWSHISRSTCGNNGSVAEHLNNQFCLHQCQVCKKRTSQYNSANANWNNGLPNLITGTKKSQVYNSKVANHGMDEVPTVDFKSDKSQTIMQAVNEHYRRHSQQLMPIGIPPSLTIHEAASKMVRTKYILSRLMFLTACYFVAFLIPCLTELAILPYSTVLYMSSSFKVLLQFISLLIFSHDFRQRLMKYFPDTDDNPKIRDHRKSSVEMSSRRTHH